jgi:hypothetical protein
MCVINAAKNTVKTIMPGLMIKSHTYVSVQEMTTLVKDV